MAYDQINIRTYSCPHCGFKLSVGEKTGRVECPQCGFFSDISVQKEAPQPKNVEYTDKSFNMAFIGGATKNPESVLIYLQDYLEKESAYLRGEYGDVGIRELNDVIQEIKLSQGDKKETWKLAFLAISEPARLRIDSLEEIKKKIEELVQNNKTDDAYSNFFKYTSAVKSLKEKEDKIFAELQRAMNRYESMGGNVRELKEKYEFLKKQYEALATVPEKLSDIESIKTIKEELDKKTAVKLLENGISAENMYDEALHDVEAEDIATALHKFAILGSYRDSYEKYKELRYFTDISNKVMLINDKPYLTVPHKQEVATNRKQQKKLEKELATDERFNQGWDLIEVVDNEPKYKEPLVKNYKRCLAIFGNLFYYISRKGTIHVYDLKKRADLEIEQNAGHEEDIFYKRFDNNSKGLLLSYDNRPIGENNTKIHKGEEVEIDVSGINMHRLDILDYGNSGNLIRKICDKVDAIVPFKKDVYFKGDYICISRLKRFKKKLESGDFHERNETHRVLVNLKTGQQFTDFMDPDDHIVDIIGNDVYFKRYAPTKYNISLLKKNLETGEETFILTNALEIVEIQDDNVFYTVGNTDKTCLVNYNMVTKERHTVMDRYQTYLGHYDGYFYLFRGSAYNLTLFKVKDDGSDSMVVASNIDPDDDAYFELKEGYFYYENIFGELCVSRIDGSETKVVARDLDDVLDIKGSTIYYSTTETTDMLYENESNKSGTKYRRALSIYKYNADDRSSEKIIFGVDKWVYNKDGYLFIVRLNDEEYKTTNMPKNLNYKHQTVLEEYYKINLETLEEKHLLTIGLPHAEKPKAGCSIIWWLFHRKDNMDVEFKKLPRIRPYLTDRRKDDE